MGRSIFPTFRKNRAKEFDNFPLTKKKEKWEKCSVPFSHEMRLNMSEIIKIIGIGILALIVIIILKQYRPEFAIYISILAGIAIILIAMQKMGEVVSLIQSIAERASINSKFLSILIKITGIAILTEFAVSICKDSGESAIASKIEIGSKVVIVSMSIPIISSLLEVMLNILP